ncbi:unnamed protein product [Pleuronectes platessa]|uniref:Uncharacterized protein n=1 Tax=Pleuronectes platessa TaxID=8262 RepID=A0A9N7TQJ4_PLEPL|nr:unnamed protein product [Pleuronectes platessa]
MEEAGFMIFTAINHQGAIGTLWLHFWELSSMVANPELFTCYTLNHQVQFSAGEDQAFRLGDNPLYPLSHRKSSSLRSSSSPGTSRTSSVSFLSSTETDLWL